jgi:hypothetical protein
MGVVKTLILETGLPSEKPNSAIGNFNKAKSSEIKKGQTNPV